MRLNFNHLYYFYVVAKEGSIKLAAEKLHISQPTISDQLKLLEEYFDCELFERRNRSLIINKEGKLALNYCENIFGMAAELTGKLRNKAIKPKTSIDIGITHFMSHYFLYDTILPLYREESSSVSLKEGLRLKLLVELEEGKLDIIFTDSKADISSNMRAYRVGVNKTYVVAHKKFKNYKKNFPDCLNQIPFLNYTSDSFLKYEIELYFAKHNIAPRILGEADDIDLMYMVTENAMAFTIVPEVAKNRFMLNKEVITLGEMEDLQTTVWAIIKSNYDGPALKILQDQGRR